MQPMLPVATSAAPVASMFFTLRSQQLRGNLRLHDVVGAGRAAAADALARLLHGEAGLCRSSFGWRVIFWPCCIEQAEW